MSDEDDERTRRFARAVKDELMKDEQFWQKVREQAGEGWWARRKKADDDLEL